MHMSLTDSSVPVAYTCDLLFCPSTGAFGAHPDHDAHILSTLSAIQILVIHDALDMINVPRVVSCKYRPMTTIHHLPTSILTYATPLHCIPAVTTTLFSHIITAAAIWRFRG